MSAIRNPRIASPESLVHLSLLLSPSQGNSVHSPDFDFGNSKLQD